MSPLLRDPLRLAPVLVCLGLAPGIAGAPLAAQIPVAFDDTRLTDVGPAGDPSIDAVGPHLVWNRVEERALLTWVAPGVDGAGTEIYAALVDPQTMELASEVLQVSAVAAVAGESRDAFGGAAALNPLDSSYLVVWHADDPAFGLADGQQEVFGRRVVREGNAWTVSEVGPISESGGPAALTNRDATQAFVTFGDAQQEWLVVWRADDAGALLADNEYEIFARRVTAAFELQPGPTRVSSMGPNGGAGDAGLPSVVYHPPSDSFAVFWMGDDVGFGWLADRMEIFGNLLAGATALPIIEQTRVSFAGPTDSPMFGSAFPRAVWNPDDDRILIAWTGNREEPGLSPDEIEIWAQELAPDLSFADGEVLRVSEMGAPGDELAYAIAPVVAWEPGGRQYLFLWTGWHTATPPVALAPEGGPFADVEIWGRSFQPLAAGGFAAGPQLAVSNLGAGSVEPEEYDADFGHDLALLGDGRLLAVFAGDDDRGGMVEGEVEIFGETVAGPWIFVDGFEAGDTARWSAAAP
jgi:hypothetical protein